MSFTVPNNSSAYLKWLDAALLRINLTEMKSHGQGWNDHKMKHWKRWFLMASPELPKPWKVSQMELFLVGLVALVVGIFLGSKLVGFVASPVVKDLQKTQAIDRASYLFTLRRELANILIWRDPQRYVELYKELCSEFNSFKSWRLEEINKRLSELSKEYPFYTDFDTWSALWAIAGFKSSTH